jgi:deglycase
MSKKVNPTSRKAPGVERARAAIGRTAGRRGESARSATASKGRVAVILAELFEDSEFQVPYDRLREEGYEPVVIASEGKKTLSGKSGRVKVKPDRTVNDVSPDDFDALVIPGGYSPDHLRTDSKMVAFTRDMFDAGKPVAAICHAGSMLIEADLIAERTVTSWPSIRTDLLNAGAEWVDREVVEDDNLITSRKPDDLDAFTDTLLRQLERRKGLDASESPAPDIVPREHPETPS